ncbi:MAG: hypothetical protein QMD50_02870 [Patescibacteria group bacterium]|nr:hypothetical protein [Patescibacteria group bacterium]
MMKSLKGNDWPLIRFIAPIFPEVNIFSRAAEKTTPLGLINVATAANKVWGFRVEVIDENNYRGPRDKRVLPDHSQLQKESPASIVGFYCGLTSTMERVFELADFYHAFGVVNLAGSWHAHYCEDEVLNRNIDIVVHGDADLAIQQILCALRDDKKVSDIAGISFWEGVTKKTNPPAMIELPDLSQLPYPDFGLLRYSRKMNVYPIGRGRGCGMNCEFCSVRGALRCASARYLFGCVKWLVDTRGARNFFIVDDRLEEDLEGIAEFFRMIYEMYGDWLDFMVQIRLETARNVSFLELMRKAGVRSVAVGYESPIDEELKAMRKGYSSRHMIEWTKTLRRYFWVHGMFIFGYPSKKKNETFNVLETTKRFKKFIRAAKISSIQILHPVPIVGSDLRVRLDKEKRIFPLDVVPWSKYDGNFVCFIPDNMNLSEFQEAPIKIMKWFYSSFSFLRIPFRTIIFPIHYLIKGWRHWYYGWLRDIVRYGGYRLLKRWQKSQRNDLFIARLEEFKNKTMTA